MNIKKALLNNKKEILNISIYSNEQVLLDYIASKINKIKIIQFYIKDLSDMQNLKLASKIQQLCSFYDALFIINSRVDLALILNCDGVFLNKNDLTIDQAKKIMHNEDKIIATSYISNDSDYVINNYELENKIFKIG